MSLKKEKRINEVRKIKYECINYTHKFCDLITTVRNIFYIKSKEIYIPK